MQSLDKQMYDDDFNYQDSEYENITIKVTQNLINEDYQNDFSYLTKSNENSRKNPSSDKENIRSLVDNLMDSKSNFKDLNILTNRQQLSQMMNDPHLRRNIQQILANNNTCRFSDSLLLEINSDSSEYELDKNDLLDAFKNYFNIKNVEILQSGKAVLQFFDIISALFAMKSLNGHQIHDTKIQLSVEWYYNDQSSKQSDMNNNDDDSKSSCSENPSNSIKYTCRYDIQIYNDKQFQVARKIIGSKGYNMKYIIDCCAKVKNSETRNGSYEHVKLRLRGQGSGYQEGPEKMESQEPLHLCVSSRYKSVYKVACHELEELLRKIYDEYKEYCQQKGKYIDPKLSIKKQESTNGQLIEPNTPVISTPLTNPPTTSINSNYVQPVQNLNTRTPFTEVVIPQQPEANTFVNTIHTVSKESLNQEQDDEALQLSEGQINQYIEARNKARRELDFDEADRIRNILQNKGIALMDEQGGRGKGAEVTTWKFSKTPYA